MYFIKNKIIAAVMMLTLLPLGLKAQCSNTNTLLGDITPTFNPISAGVAGFTNIQPGFYATVNVCAGATYTFSMCDNGAPAYDPIMTVYNNASGVLIGWSDNYCGVYPQVTYEATFTGTVRILIDQAGFCGTFGGPQNTLLCYMNSNCGTSAAPAGIINDATTFGCNADIGTFTYTYNGAVFDPVTEPVVLCAGNATNCVEVISNQDWIQAPSVSNPTVDIAEIMYAVYTCPPPAAPDPLVDACYSGVLWSGQDFDLCGNTATGIPPLIGGASNYWLVPVTSDDGDNNGNPNGAINIDQDGDGCYAVGQSFEVMEVNQIQAGTVNENCYNGVISFELNGGQPEADGSNYVITNNANGTIVSGTATAGEIVVVNGLNNGDTYDFTISDQSGSCPITVSGTYVSCPCPNIDFTFTSPVQCDDGLQVLSADQSAMATGEAITPCYYVQVAPTNAETGNTIEYFENGTSLGSLAATPNTNYSGYISPIDPTQTNTFELCETTAGVDMTYYVIDCHSGDVITSGTWVSDGTCQTVIVTPPGTNMSGTSSWTGPGIVATSPIGAAIFDPGVAGPGSHSVTYNWDAGNGCSGSATNTIVVQDAVPPILSCPSNINDNTDPGGCTANVVNPDPTYSDNCSNLTLTWALTGATTGSSPATGINVVGTQSFNLGVTTVTYTLTDGANTVTCSYTVTVTDNIPPTAVCQPLTVNLDAAGNATITPAQIDNGSSDNCGIVNYTLDITSFDCADVGTNTVTLTVTDAAGLTDNCTAVVTVVDNIAPTAVCQPLTVNLDAAGNATITPAQIDNGSSDNCGIVNYALDISSFDCADVGTNTVTLTVTDAAGLTDNCTAVVTVVDNIPPTAVCQPLTINLDAAGNATITPAQIDNGSSDNCGIVDYSLDITSFDCADVGTNTVTLTVTDAAGLTDNCTAVVTVVDNIAPTAVCQPLTVNLDAAGNATITPAQIDNGSSDNCGIVNYALDISSFDCADVGANTVTLTVEDAAGNTNSCTAVVTVVDNIAPTAVCQPLTVNLDAAGNATITPAQIDNGSSDNCGIVNYSLDITSFGCADVGANTVTLTVEDAAGNTNSCTAVVTVVDNIAPTAVCQPLTVNLDAAGNATITPAQIDNGSSDNCGIVNYSLDITSFGCADVGANTVTLTVTDAAGLTDNCTAVVTVVDNIAPTAICQPITVNLDATGNATITTTQIDNGSSDNCGIVNYTLDITSFDCADIGTNTVTLTVTDAAGLTDNCTAIVTVVDPNVPTASAGADDAICEVDTYTLSGSSGGSATTGSWSTSGDGSFVPGVTDPNATYTPGPTDISNGSVTLTWTTDAAPCATASASMILTINPNPEISITPTDPTTCNGTNGFITVNSVSGLTSGDVSWTGTSSSNDNGINLPHDITGLGAGNYNVTFTDANGCSSNIESTLLNNPGAPVIDIILDTTSCGVDYIVPNPTTYINGTNLSGNQAFYSAPGGNAADEIIQGTVITSAMSPMTIYVYDNSGTCSAEISFVVVVNENPTTTISPDPAITCEGTPLNIDGNPAGGSGTYTTHVWTGDVSILSSTNIQSPSTLTGATFGTYNLTYTVTDDNGCTATDNIAVEINETPVLSGDQDICVDEVTTITSTGTPDGTTPWTLSDPLIASVDASGNVTGIAAGSVDITFLDANGCSAIIVMTVDPKPVITLSPFDPASCNGTDGYITVNGAGTGTVDWSGQSTGSVNSTSLSYDITNLEAGNYDVTFTNDLTGCESDVASTTLINPGAPVIDMIDDTSSCEIDFVIPDPTTYITGTDLTGGQSFYSAPGGNAGDELVQGTVITSGMSPMTVYVFDNNGVCESETSFIVNVNENPTVSISPNPFEACTDENIQVNGNPSGGSGNFVNHDWTNTGAVDLDDPTIVNPIYNTSIAGNYDLTYTVEDDNGCTASETISFTVLERTVIDPVSAIVVCGVLELDSLPTITGANLSGNEAYYDDTQANGGQVVSGNITSSGSYYIYDTGGNCSNEVLVDVTINEIPQITSLLEDTTYCDFEVPDDITFTVSGQPDWTIEYLLDGVNQTVTSSQNTVNLGNAPGVYTITLIEDNLCADTINVEFEMVIQPTPPSPATYEDTEYCASDELDSMRAEGTGGILSWYRNDLQQFLGVGERSMPENNIGSTTYYITETVNGCESEPSQITIDILDCEFILSTAITPDNDGLNDTWELPRLDDIYPNNVVQVYNRWGSLIFEHDSSSEGPYNDNPWDGTINGERLPVGSYFFVIDHNDGSGETTNGAISIILD